jgi:hypothetical protein
LAVSDKPPYIFKKGELKQMKITDVQINAKSFATLMNERTKAKAGSIPIVCINAEGQSVTKYAPLLQIMIDVDGVQKPIGEFLELLYNDIEKKNQKIIELTDLFNETKVVAEKAIAIVKNIEKYMPTDYIGL